MKKNLLLFILMISTSLAFSQTTVYKRIVINNPTPEIVKELQNIGIDLRCGVKINEDKIQLELPQFELNQLNNAKIDYDVKIEDVSRFYKNRIDATYDKALKELKKEKELNRTDRASVSSTIIDNFLEYTGCNEVNWITPTNFNLGTMGGCLTVSETLAELDEMKTLYPSLISAKTDASPTSQTTWGNPTATTFNNGISYQGQGTTRWNPQTVYYVRITGDQSSAEGTKPQMLFTSMIHARELSSLMGNIYFMWYLLENYATDPAIKNLVDNNELYFIPIVNPDGLRWNEHLSSTGGGMQRKNCRPNTGSTSNSTTTRGVDLNRNFDYFWGNAGSGSSSNPSSDSYRGPSAFSEPETQILRDFVLARNIKTCLMNHSYANAIPHPYGGNPTFVSGREDEMHKWHEDMTRYNRYISGATIFPAANGIADDWMVGGNTDGNGSVGSGQNILATTPEHGHTGFWPATTEIIPIAKRAVRLYLTSIYYGGKYAKFHDLTQSDITALSSNLTFGIERLGQTASDFTLTVTPISTNIISITSPSTQTGMVILEQRNVTAALTLDSNISPNDKIEYKVELANGDGVVFYEANIQKYYQPTVLFNHNPDTDALTNWTTSGGWSTTTTSAYTGTTSIKDGAAIPYANNATKTLTTTNSYDFTSASEVLIQFYTKWDLERNFDFVELLGSADGGTTWQSLCGKYNKPNSTLESNDSHGGKTSTSHSFQANNSSGQVYDGDRMDNWVMEEVAINSSDNSFLSTSSNVKFRFRFKTDANNKTENYSTTSEGFFIDDFKIITIQIPCDSTNPPSGITVSGITATGADVTWNAIPSSTYDLRYKEVGALTWTTITNITTASYTFTGLTPTTDYELQVNTRCTSSTSIFSASSTFTTLAISYCASNGQSTADEYIGNVTLGSINNNSGTGTTSTGYSDFTAAPTATQITDLDIDATSHSISVSKTWTGTNYDEAISVWIDFNQDGDFEDAGENVFSDTANQNSPVSGTFSIPSIVSGTVLGNTRMRVSLKYNAIPTSCESFNYGEVEDYTVNIFSSVLGVNNETETLNSISVYPNPVKEQLFINAPTSVQLLDYKLSNAIGQSILTSKFKNSNKIDVSQLNTGVYFISINTDKGTITKKIMIK